MVDMVFGDFISLEMLITVWVSGKLKRASFMGVVK